MSRIPGSLFVLIWLLCIASPSYAQKVGLGTISPEALFHIRGTTNSLQLIIDASAAQTNSQPLIRLRKSTGLPLVDIHSDDSTNTFLGVYSGRVNTPTSTHGIHNTLLGSRAGYANTAGRYTTAVGSRALTANTTGNSNSAFGRESLMSNLTGHNNTAIGKGTLLLNVIGSGNTAVGTDALSKNEADENTAIGYGALFWNSTGDQNIAGGAFSLNQNTTGHNNTAYGYHALRLNTTGIENTAVGSGALEMSQTASENTAIGGYALQNNTTGYRNTAVGDRALFNNTTGYFNTAIGAYATNFSGTTPINFTALGYGAGGVASNSNRVEIGNTSVTWIGGQVGWSTFSDGRIKDNVQSNVPGLAFINKLRPVTYQINVHTQNHLCGISDIDQWPGKYDLEDIMQSGFIAQEVETAANEIHYDFNGITPPSGNGKLYSLNYAAFVVPLTKSVQELSTQNDALRADNANLSGLVAALAQQLEHVSQKLVSIERTLSTILQSEAEKSKCVHLLIE